MSERLSPKQRAIDEYRDAFPEDSHVPDERIAKMLPIQQRAFGIALTDLWREVKALVLVRGRFRERVRGWTFCPECMEIECDDDCRYYEVRRRAGCWIE